MRCLIECSSTDQEFKFSLLKCRIGQGSFRPVHRGCILLEEKRKEKEEAARREAAEKLEAELQQERLNHKKLRDAAVGASEQLKALIELLDDAPCSGLHTTEAHDEPKKTWPGAARP